MQSASTEPNQHTRFRLDPVERGRVVQTEAGGTETTFDAMTWGAFTRGSRVVRAVKIPRTFRVDGDVCKDGYLVFDGGLFAISTLSFNRDYRPLTEKVKAAA